MAEEKTPWSDFSSKIPEEDKTEIEEIMSIPPPPRNRFLGLGVLAFVLLISLIQLFVGGGAIMMMSSIAAEHYQQFAPGLGYWTSVVIAFWLGILYGTVSYRYSSA